MLDRERSLKIIMRVFGGAALLAIPFVFVPWSWMDAIHDELLGMGRLPDEPVVGYLARSLSAFYAMLGGVFVLTSFDLRRYRPVVGYLVATSFAFALVVAVIDFVEGMPLFWFLGEGSAVAVMAGVMLYLWRGVPRE